ncbi:AsmA-like C-terminal region [Salinihabitans flavidus]|uniref:AsmA-like C-terminal region n=1 Tax=Salinihabitans flavidus TaxID=569882 RepID=A0A1H8QBF2_9RHOB|nr:DUF3971 domain-containing protein [Salinihabitans flavidus]SEO51542.1 AsmA-like C-terminal region [Salinihabitans flavidus]
MSDRTSQDIPKRRRGRRAGIWALLSLALLAMLAGGALWFATGRQMEVPQAIRDRIEAQIDALVPEIDLRFSRMFVTLESSGRPRVVLRDIRLREPTGGAELTLRELDGTLSLTALLEGRFAPKRVHMTGAFLTARRDAQGKVDVSLGEYGASGIDLGAMMAGLDGALQRPEFRHLVAVQLDAVTLRYEDLRAGRGWTVDGGRLRLERAEGGLRLSADLAVLSGGAEAATVQMSYESAIGSTAAEFGVNFEDMAAGDMASQSAALAWLGILNAPISGALRASMDDSGAMGPMHASLQIGAGVLQPNDEIRPIPFRSAQSYFTYAPGSQTLRFDELSVVSDWVTARAEGQAHLRDLVAGWPSELLGQFRLTSFTANPAGVYDRPVALDLAEVDFRLRLDPFDLTLGQMMVQKDGQSLRLNGQLSATADDWNLALDGRMDALSRTGLVEFWPPAIKPKTRDWIETNIFDGALEDINLAVRSRPGERPGVYMDFKFRDTDLRFMKTMPPVRGASGHVTWMDNRMTVVAEGGQVMADAGGAVAVAGTSLVIHDTRIKQAPARVRLRTDSTVTAALSLLNRAPLRVMDKAGLPVALAEGRASASGQLDLRLKKDLQPEDVIYEIEGTLSGLHSEALVKDRVLRAEALTVRANNDGVWIGGDGQIGAVPFSGQWHSKSGPKHRGKSRIEATLELDERFVEEFRIGLPEGSFWGRTQGAIEVDLQDGRPPAFTMSSALDGLGLAIPALGWTKPEAAAGQLVVAGRLGQPPAIDRLSLDVAGLSAEGDISIHADGGLDRARFGTLTIGSWLDVVAELRGRGPGVAPAVEVTGGRVDMRDAPQSGRAGSGTGQGGGPISARLDRVQISEGIALTDFNGDFTTRAGVDGRFSGRVNGDTGVTGAVTPRGSRSAFRIQSEDAGGVFRSAGVLKQATGGAMDLTLIPVGDAGNYDGNLRVRNIRLRNAPAMAALLNAISVIGLLEQLGGQGIHFSDVEAQFRLSPDRIHITQGSAVGPSLGLSIDGLYGLKTGRFDLQGVISPIYLLNAVGRVISRRGEGLFGFNYYLRGTGDDPRVQVNPLSVLTPGIFRDIFRRRTGGERSESPVPELNPQAER